MSKKEILEKVICLFATMTDEEEITEESEIIDDLGLSSMDVLFLVSSMEAEFDMKIPEVLVQEMVTINDVVDIIAERL